MYGFWCTSRDDNTPIHEKPLIGQSDCNIETCPHIEAYETIFYFNILFPENTDNYI